MNLIFDTETTGLKDPEVIEATWLSVEWGVYTPLDEYCQLFKPSKPIELGALATHNILEEELTDCAPSSSFQLPPNTQYLIGHNIDFDWKVIGSPPVRRICTQALSRYIWPDLDSYKQSALVYHLLPDKKEARFLLKNAHAALSDVKNCRRLLSYILAARPEITSWEELWVLSEIARIPAKMPFGKHKGKLIAQVPGPYKKWLLNQPDVDPYLIAAITRRKP